jgi:hypothetical protein
MRLEKRKVKDRRDRIPDSTVGRVLHDPDDLDRLYAVGAALESHALAERVPLDVPPDERLVRDRDLGRAGDIPRVEITAGAQPCAVGREPPGRRAVQEGHALSRGNLRTIGQFDRPIPSRPADRRNQRETGSGHARNRSCRRPDAFEQVVSRDGARRSSGDVHIDDEDGLLVEADIERCQLSERPHEQPRADD